MWGLPTPSTLVAALISAVLQACDIYLVTTLLGGVSPSGFRLAFPYIAALTSQVWGPVGG